MDDGSPVLDLSLSLFPVVLMLLLVVPPLPPPESIPPPADEATWIAVVEDDMVVTADTDIRTRQITVTPWQLILIL